MVGRNKVIVKRVQRDRSQHQQDQLPAQSAPRESIPCPPLMQLAPTVPRENIKTVAVKSHAKTVPTTLTAAVPAQRPTRSAKHAQSSALRGMPKEPRPTSLACAVATSTIKEAVAERAHAKPALRERTAQLKTERLLKTSTPPPDTGAQGLGIRLSSTANEDSRAFQTKTRLAFH